MRTIEAVTEDTLDTYYNRPDGNLYWFNTYASFWELVDGFDVEDCRSAMANGIKFAFLAGPAVSHFVTK